MGNIKLSATPKFLILAAVMLLLLPLPWVTGWFLAVAVHELSHCIALFLCGVPIICIEIDMLGAKIGTAELSWGQTIICALAGPFGGLLLLTGKRFLPHAAVCALVQSAYNLLPVYPFDGGRAIHALMSGLFGRRIGEITCKVITWIVIVMLLCILIAGTIVWDSGLLLALGVAFAAKFWKIKIPCK